MGVMLGAPDMIWVKSGLVLAALSLLSACDAVAAARVAPLSVPEKLPAAVEVMGQLCPAVPSCALLVPLLEVPFLEYSVEAEWKIMSKVQNLSWCISFCLGQVVVCRRGRNGDSTAQGR